MDKMLECWYLDICDNSVICFKKFQMFDICSNVNICICIYIYSQQINNGCKNVVSIRLTSTNEPINQ